LAALASLVLLYRHSKLIAVVLATILAGYSGIYFVVHNTLRYQHPLWWIQVLLIGWAAHLLQMPLRASLRSGAGFGVGSGVDTLVDTNTAWTATQPKSSAMNLLGRRWSFAQHDKESSSGTQ
jgi:hypothetical protein